MLDTGPAARSPASECSSSAGKSQCRPSSRGTGPLGNRATVSIAKVSGPTRPRTTRPLDAPRSTAATVIAPEFRDGCCATSSTTGTPRWLGKAR